MSRALRRLASRLLPAAVAEPLRRWLRNRVVARFGAYDAVHRYGAVSRTVHIADPLAQGWYDHDWDAPSEIGALVTQGWLRPGALVFDAGAHQGVVAMMLADAVSPGGRVVAVEANPHNARVLARNFTANGIDGGEAVAAAIADRDGHLWFEDRWNGAVSPQEGVGVRVEAVTLDTLASRYGMPRVVMLDVEGFELHALRGAERLLGERDIAWMIEVHVNAGLERFGSAEEVLALLRPGRQLLVAPGEAGDFVPLEQGAAIVSDRFRLLAVPR